MALCLDGDISDDEIFMGKLTLQEIKKRLLPDRQRRTISCASNEDEINNSTESIEIIETHSEPEMNSESDIATFANVKSDLKQKFTNTMTKSLSDESMDESFLKLEEAVTCAGEIMNNTMEVVNLVLNNVSLKETKNVDIEIIGSNKNPSNNYTENNGTCQDSDTFERPDEKNNLNIGNTDVVSLNKSCDSPLTIEIQMPNENIKNKTEEFYINPSNISTHTYEENKIQEENTIIEVIIDNEIAESNIDDQNKTPIKRIDKINKSLNSDLPLKNNFLKPPVQEFVSTPSMSAKNIQHQFKTPKNVASVQKNVSSIKKSPATTKSFQHVMSPVAHYIKRSPQAPLIRNVYPKKPLHGGTAIVQIKNKASENKPDNKENVVLPFIAYRNAKKTEVITVSEKKMPQSPWAEKLISSTPVVRRHVNRSPVHTRTPIASQQEDSFANLSVIEQAETSIHVEKSAFTH